MNFLRCLLVAAMALASSLLAPAAHAQDDRLLAETRQVLADVERALPAERDSYDGVLRLRNQVEPYRNQLRLRMRELEPRKTELAQQITHLGPKPAGEEPAALADQRKRLMEAQASFETEYKQTLLASQQSERMWNQLTEQRRTLFSTRLLMHVQSILDPHLWIDFVDRQLPRLSNRTRLLAQRWADYIDENDSGQSGIVLAASVLVLVALFFWLHAVISRRRAKAEAASAEMPSEVDVIRRSAIVFVMRTIPMFASMLLFNLVIRRLNLAPLDVDDFLLSIAIALLVVGAARGAMGALLSPGAPRWRIIRASDETARTVYRLVIGAVDIYTIGIVLTSYQRLIEARVELQIITIMILTTAMIVLAAWSLSRIGRGDGPVHGFFQVNLGWLRPLVWLACILCALELAFGYVALAGFTSGRITIATGAIAVAIYVVWTLNNAFDRRRLSATTGGSALARSIGTSAQTLDLLATALSGVLRFIVIVTAGLILLMPWGLEYGDVNPFADFSHFVTTTDLHNWLGSFGFGLLAFAVGLTGTRIIVGWLDSSLLPRTSLDESLRHSVRTVLGYAGFAVTTLVTLSLLGINAQNVAVVAGALSVGIGFGLQSIVSNFVSGLIVLAERPIRVGDIVVVKGEEGVVERISVRSTLIGTGERSSLIVPNSDLITSIVRNRTLTDPTQQLRFNLLLDHDADPVRACELVMELACQHPNVLTSPLPRTLFMRLTELGQEFEIRCNIDRFENMLQTRSDLHLRIVQAFRKHDIRMARIPTATAALASTLAKSVSARA